MPSAYRQHIDETSQSYGAITRLAPANIVAQGMLAVVMKAAYDPLQSLPCNGN